MKNGYREIEFGAGVTIESAIRELKKHASLVCASFNGEMLYSDIDDIDSAYKKITGKTKAEFNEDERKRHEEYIQKEEEHKLAIPNLTKEWINKGNVVLDKRYHELWAECVPIRLSDLYHGMELGACLDIIQKLNSGCDIKEAKTMIENQGHSGMSFGLVCSMVGEFCDRGKEFVKHVR